MQRNPSLDFHVITEMTAEGRKFPPPTPQSPAFYAQAEGKFTALGQNTPANEHPPAAADLARVMAKALAAQNYLLAGPATPPPHAFVVLSFGSFARFSTAHEDERDTMALDSYYRSLQDADPDFVIPPPFIRAGDERSVGTLLPIVLANRPQRTDILQRAELVGGAEFARALNDALDQEAQHRAGRAGQSANMNEDASSPFNRFANANADRMNLVEDSFCSCYYIIATAFDYAAAGKGKKVVLWRTKMTVNSSGISMTESLPSLLATAAPYFGKEMRGPVTLTRQIAREGKVEIGTPTVVPDSSAQRP